MNFLSTANHPGRPLYFLRRIIGGVVIVMGLTALVAALFVLPLRDYFNQNTAIAQRKIQFEALADANEQLSLDINRLNTTDGVIAAARSELGYVFPGEQRIQLLAMPALPTTLPLAWPYSLVTDILRVRAANTGSASGGLAPLAP
ncbi:MAG: septum formation initiator family protein [Ilumatobacteraceae bacterium]|nr:septum formation initiator family protein [Ilumatobacteraceae bacterium]